MVNIAQAQMNLIKHNGIWPNKLKHCDLFAVTPFSGVAKKARVNNVYTPKVS